MTAQIRYPCSSDVALFQGVHVVLLLQSTETATQRAHASKKGSITAARIPNSAPVAYAFQKLRAYRGKVGRKQLYSECSAGAQKLDELGPNIVTDCLNLECLHQSSQSIIMLGPNSSSLEPLHSLCCLQQQQHQQQLHSCSLVIAA